MTLIWLLLGLATFALAANWLHAIRLRRAAQRAETPAAEDAAAVPAPPAAPRQPDVPPDTKPGYWFRKLFSPPLILGVLALVAQPVILWVNCYLLSITLGIIYDTTPEPIAHLKLWQLERDIGLFDAVALMVSVGQMLLASTALHKRVSGSNGTSALGALAAAGWFTLAAYEVGASVYRSWLTGEAVHEAALAGLIALGVVLLEAVCGSLVFEFLIAPLVLGCFWSVAAAVRLTARLFGAAGAVVRPAFGRLRAGARRAHGLGGSLLEAADDVLQPLRDLDRVVYDGTVGRLAGRLTARQAAPLALLLLLLPPGAGAQITRPTQQPAVDWYAAFDDTWSVPPHHLAAFKGEIFQKLILVHLREKDTLYLFNLDRKRERKVEYLDLTGGRFHSAVITFYRSKVESICRAPVVGPTDYGAALDFINRTVAVRRNDPRQAAPLAFFFTDGEPSGPQTMPSAACDARLKLVFVGVQEKNERALRTFLRRAQVGDAQVELVRVDDGWQAWLAGFSQQLRRTPNSIVVQRLQSARR